jgi:hypothetical protein
MLETPRKREYAADPGPGGLVFGFCQRNDASRRSLCSVGHFVPWLRRDIGAGTAPRTESKRLLNLTAR